MIISKKGGKSSTHAPYGIRIYTLLQYVIVHTTQMNVDFLIFQNVSSKVLQLLRFYINADFRRINCGLNFGCLLFLTCKSEYN